MTLLCGGWLISRDPVWRWSINVLMDEEAGSQAHGRADVPPDPGSLSDRLLRPQGAPESQPRRARPRAHAHNAPPGLRRWSERSIMGAKGDSPAGGASGRAGAPRVMQVGLSRWRAMCLAARTLEERGIGPSILPLSQMLRCDGHHVGRVRQVCLILVRPTR